MSENSPEVVVVVPKRPYRKELKTLDERAKEILTEKYKGERRSFRHGKKRLIIPFSQEEYVGLAAKYNTEIKKERRDRQNELARTRRAALRQFKIENTESTFIIHMTLQSTYYKRFYDHVTKVVHQVEDVVTWNESTQPITAKHAAKYIPDYIVNDLELDDGYKTIKVIEYHVEYMNVPEVARNRRNPAQHLMRCSYVLRNNWLKYSHGIADYAYHATDNACVYYQMTKFLLDPPTGRPTQFVLKHRTSENALFRFFRQYIRDHSLERVYPDFTMTTGVSAELLAGLCEEIGRNMYAYDADNKLFHSVLTHSSKHYCPVVFYKMNGHCYLINDKRVIRSVAENNKNAVTKIISCSVVEERATNTDVVVQHMESFDVSAAPTLSEGYTW